MKMAFDWKKGQIVIWLILALAVLPGPAARPAQA